MRNWFFGQMAMYAAYHRDTRNQATHHVGVPAIVFSLMVLAAQVTIAMTDAGPLTFAAILIALLLLVYLVAVPLVGMVAVLVYGTLLYLAEGVPAGLVWPVFGLAFVGGWIVLFIGHAFEGRRPALFSNLLQVFMAPAFLIMEILFACGLLGAVKTEIEARMPAFLPEHGKDGAAA